MYSPINITLQYKPYATILHTKTNPSLTEDTHTYNLSFSKNTKKQHKEKQKPAQRHFKTVIIVILLQKHMHVEMKAIMLQTSLLPLLLLEVLALAVVQRTLRFTIILTLLTALLCCLCRCLQRLMLCQRHNAVVSVHLRFTMVLLSFHA